MDLPAVRLLCLEQGKRSLEEQVEEFLNLTNLTSYLDNCLCSFLLAGLNTATRAQFSGEGPPLTFQCPANYTQSTRIYSLSPPQTARASPTQR